MGANAAVMWAAGLALTCGMTCPAPSPMALESPDHLPAILLDFPNCINVYVIRVDDSAQNMTSFNSSFAGFHVFPFRCSRLLPPADFGVVCGSNERD